MNHFAHKPHSGAPQNVDYIIVVSNEEYCRAGYYHFAEKVNRKLKSGYQLYGQPFNVSQVLCQAMVRSAEAPASGDTTMFFKPSVPLKH